MKSGKWFVFVFAAFLVVAVIWGIRGTRPDAESADPAVESVPVARQQEADDPGRVASEPDAISIPDQASEDAESEQRRDVPEVAPDSRLAIMREAEDAASAIERARALERLSDTDPALAAKKLMELAHFCAPDNLRSEEREDSSVDLVEQRRAWCTGLELSPEAMKARLEELTRIEEDLEGESARIERLARDPYLGRQYEMEQELADAPEQDRSDRFTRFVRRARDFDDLNRLMQLNMLHAQDNEGQPMWRLGVERRRRLYPQAELLQAQTVAMILFGCRRFGGCESGQYMTMLVCTIGIFGQCGPDSSLQEQVYLTTAPANYSLARDILASL